MRIWIVCGCIAAFALFAGFLAQHIADDAKIADASDITKIADWVRNSGRDGYVAGDVAKVLGLGSGTDVSSRGQVFSDPKKLAYYSAVLAGSNIVMSRQSREINIFWLIKNDEIEKTVVSNGSTFSVVPNDAHRPEWIDVKDFFLRKATAQTEQ